jgi:hypothetical protein
MELEKVSEWAYILVVVIAVVMGLVVGYMAWSGSVGDVDGWIMLIMLILGLIIGLLSITTKEVTPFLIATIALVVAASANVWAPLQSIHALLYDFAVYILKYIVAFAAPAAVVVALKSVLNMIKEK